MVSPLKNRIQEDMKAALRAKDSERLGVIRLLLAAMKQREVDERIELNDRDIVTIINKMIKQRLDSSAQFQVANRQDLVAKEQKEIEIIHHYLPQQMSEYEIDIAIQTALETSPSRNKQDLSKIMALLKEQMSGRADMVKVSQKVKSFLK